jgi:hypothetical protein
MPRLNPFSQTFNLWNAANPHHFLGIVYRSSIFKGKYRQSLTLKCAASNSDISDETALRLLQLVDEGFDLQIPEETEVGDFLENFRNRTRKD